ncbi:MAG: hypothetical protein CK425_08700 [Parachlamydia sp.]|nr:MAG: hypothetical protein CK425_08700 [Parachlamydia sp.]
MQADNPLADDDVEELESLGNEDSRLIVVNWENEKGKFTSIRIPLSTDQYRRACDAHRDE